MPVLRIDHISIKDMLLGVWQASFTTVNMTRLWGNEPLLRSCFPNRFSRKTGLVKTMKTTKFVVKVNRGGTLAPEYVERIDRTPIRMTLNRKVVSWHW